MAAGKVKRAQTAGEELANTLSHGFGAMLALGGAIPLVVRAAMSGSAKAVFSLAAYGISLVVLYTASTVYHAVKRPSLKAVLRVMDHCSIFLLILGTYIPMSLLVVGGRTGWLLFLTNTTLAVVGITLNAIDLKRFDKLSLALYALMGWLVVLALRGIMEALPPAGLAAWRIRRGLFSISPRGTICTLSGTCLCWPGAFCSISALRCIVSETKKSGTGRILPCPALLFRG